MATNRIARAPTHDPEGDAAALWISDMVDSAPPGLVPLSAGLGSGWDPTNNPRAMAHLKGTKHYQDPKTGIYYVTPAVNDAITKEFTTPGSAFVSGPLRMATLIAGGAGMGALGAAGAGAGAGAGAAAGLGAADMAGLAAMAADAGLTGAAAQAFIASGGTLGSTAAAGAGMGSIIGNSADDVLAGFEGGGAFDSFGAMPGGDTIGAPSVFGGGSSFPSSAAEIAQANEAARLADVANLAQNPAGYVAQNQMSASSGLWDTIFNSLGGPNSAASKLVGGLLEAYGANQSAKKLEDIARQSAGLADPFASQRPFYQAQLKQSYTDPNFFMKNPVFRGLVDNATTNAAAQMAAGGYNGSGHMGAELTRVGTNAGFQYALPWQQQTGLNAGANFGPGAAANVYSNFSGQAAQQDRNALAALGYAAQPFVASAAKAVPNIMESLGNIFGGASLA